MYVMYLPDGEMNQVTLPTETQDSIFEHGRRMLSTLFVLYKLADWTFLKISTESCALV